MGKVLIVGTLLHDLQNGIPGALTIWLSLVAVAGIGSALLSAATRPRRRGGAVRVRIAGTASRRGRPVDESGDLRRTARELAEAARQAALTAQQRRQEWQATRDAKEAAWRAFDAADRAARRAIRAAAFGVPETPLTADEAASRERYLHRAATAAYHRGELGIEQLSVAVLHLDGWNPHRHPFEQEVILRRAGRARLLHSYQTVSDIERTAWHEAQLAAEAWHSLSKQALAATVRAEAAQSRPPVPVRHGRIRVPTQRPSLALR